MPRYDEQGGAVGNDRVQGSTRPRFNVSVCIIQYQHDEGYVPSHNTVFQNSMMREGDVAVWSCREDFRRNLAGQQDAVAIMSSRL